MDRIMIVVHPILLVNTLMVIAMQMKIVIKGSFVVQTTAKGQDSMTPMIVVTLVF